MSGLRFFVAGPPRTGTSTICHALREAKVEAVHGQDPVTDMPLAVVIQRAFLEGRDPMAYLPRYIEAVADPFMTRSPKWDPSACWPSFMPGFFRRLRKHHPECFVILNRRSAESWIKSVEGWKDLRSRLVKADLPFLPPGSGRNDDELMRWFEAYYARVRSELEGDERLIEFDIGDPEAPKILGQAAGLHLPWWGRLNAGPLLASVAAPAPPTPAPPDATEKPPAAPPPHRILRRPA